MVMSKRLQVLLDESELRKIRQLAKRKGMTVAEWVRQTLRSARTQEPLDNSSKKLKAVRDAVKHHFPSADIQGILAEIEKGYLDRKSS
jgi:hypothetical protein